ncbi:MAG: 2-vinyl bacteriochlorophyllide hydratase [Chlorobiaceae bacterium]|jgi:3-vinyl bacteriochlorophyllide hydratase|nr:2-vinyl bacteriochlorophyllide hydratase [Chlorobiaceae bacterium]
MPRYTPEQLAKRNASVWTEIQILLAPVQFVIFLTGIGLNALYASNPASIDFFWISVAILFKTLFFVILFITGMFFEKDLFGKWVFSKEFFWEDVGSSVATFFHFLYFVLAWKGYPDGTLVIWATVAYSSYIINAVQYLVRIWLEKSHERKLKLQAGAGQA